MDGFASYDFNFHCDFLYIRGDTVIIYNGIHEAEVMKVFETLLEIGCTYLSIMKSTN